MIYYKDITTTTTFITTHEIRELELLFLCELKSCEFKKVEFLD